MPRLRLRVLRPMVAVVGVVALGLLDLPRLLPVAFWGARTEGRVAELACGRGQFTYQLTIDGKDYRGRGQPGRIGVACDSLRVADSVPVYYLAARPETNFATTNPRHLLLVTLSALAAVGGVLYFGTGAVIRAFEEGERRKLVQ